MKPSLIAAPFLVLAISLAGCAATPPPAEVTALRSPSDAQAGIHNVGYSNIIGDYHHREPVQPGSWRKLNDEQAPKDGESHAH